METDKKIDALMGVFLLSRGITHDSDGDEIHVHHLYTLTGVDIQGEKKWIVVKRKDKFKIPFHN